MLMKLTPGVIGGTQVEKHCFRESQVRRDAWWHHLE